MSKRNWITRRGFLGVSAGLLSAAPSAFPLSAQSRSAAEGGSLPLIEGFLDPDNDARPGAYWIWVNGNFDIAQLTRELEDMKAKGLSGCEIFDCGTRDPKGIVPAGPAFLGPESVKAIVHATREATRLGLDLGLITSSSWNAGGPWVTPEFASKALYASQTVVSGPRRFSQELPYPEIPEPKFKGVSEGSEWDDLFSLDVAVLAFPNRGDKTIKDLSEIIGLTGDLDADGRLSWEVPSGEWVILRCVCTNNRERLAIPSPNSDGFMIDHFDPRATEMHFGHIIGRLQPELGDFRETALKYLYLPSYEIRGKRDWTPRLTEEFRQRRGYDLRPFLPTLFGWTVQDREVAERFQHDWRMTVSDLLIENHYGKAAEICHRHGLELHAESGGPGPPVHDVPVEALRALGVLDVPRGEFWNKPGDAYDPVTVLKAVGCAAHIYGKKLAEMESFTSWFHWTESPFDLKPLADNAFCEAANRFVFHTMPHRPPEAGWPGYAYHAGTHMGVTRAWWSKAKPFLDYLARGSYLLQQGLFVADVCYYYGHEAPNFVPNKRVDPSRGFGYDYDYVNTGALLERMEVRGGKIVLPDGMSYELLVLPPREDMPLEALEKLERMVRAGAVVIGPKPLRSPGLASGGVTEHRARDEKVRELAEQMWGTIDGKSVQERSYGEGKIVWGKTIRGVLRDQGAGPDFHYVSPDGAGDLDFVHRRTSDEEIYFVRNRQSRWEEADCEFRVKGKAPELWTPGTGERRRHHVYRETAHGTKLHLRFAPYGSHFVVFRGQQEDHVTSIRRGRKSLFPVSLGTAWEYPPVEVLSRRNGKFECVVWEAGEYALRTAGGGQRRLTAPSPPEPLRIGGPWRVEFEEGRGAPAAIELDRLTSWTDHDEEGVKYFSGTATYHNEFELPEEFLSGEYHLVLDLGEVAMAAEVRLNGRSLGVLWKPPFRCEVSGAVRSGKNRLHVEVVNSWNNRLVGDARLPESERRTRTNITEERRGHPGLQDSGLMGPVRLVAGILREV